VRLLANIQQYGRDVAMVTVTAPGQAVLPWADDRRCTVVPTAAWRWNMTVQARWSRLHRQAAKRTRRQCGRFRLLAYSYEVQKRGVYHLHLVVPMGTATDRHAAHVYVRHLDQLRAEHGFGFVDRGKLGPSGQRTLPVVPPGRAAAYVSKYLTKDAAHLVARADAPTRQVYVARELTAQTRVTMRTLRLRRHAHVLHRIRDIPFATALEALLGEKPTVQLLVGQHLAMPAAP
jgi:hypothetical protein